ncbi:MAG TPA: PBP1A family penicillin-binding protein [Thermoclostridium caenicola]|uniref:transglycosylase domain-containing protein n=1 Tax=Thermoclostridium caenicola TaxID=659425 RepID=UPI002BDC92B5|nr:PBP1A family penicillin-binding protein [Thermoclostridium caenicola]HOK42578.1 PBP1A family penicillin-binding protein [Thermoclostridium caenicola]HOL85037.1 PBP1A family penicillin-binding protein [Thermoclostridium caenicola]HPO76806.1 PBP1A family penicillin-binding protein [Thermoclostridium caenicola]
MDRKNRPSPKGLNKSDVPIGKNTYQSKPKRTPLSIALKIILSVVIVAFMLIIMAGSALGGVLAGSIYGLIRTTPVLEPSILKPTGLNSFVYDSEGNIIAELKREENRVWIDYEDIPKKLIDAYIAVEDKRFMEHNGIDLKRIGRAILTYVMHFFNSSVEIEGGSTITQQLIKNLTQNQEITIKRKIQEQWQAIQLEKGLTKEEILTYYLNNVPMGGTFKGIETAAKGYFGKDVRELSLAECASLAGITNWPSKYMPINEDNIKANLERTRMILGLMLEQGKITQAEYEEAMAEEIKFKYNPEAGKVMQTSNQSYFVDEAIKAVKSELMKKYQYNEQAALDIIYNGGIHIYTTLQPKVQAALDEVFTNPEFFEYDNPRTDEKPQAAMTVIEPVTGYVRGLYGGRGQKEGSVFNRATQAERSPGSSIKPILVYGPGIETRKITAATVVDDVPQYLNNKTPDKIWPKNVENKNFGLTAARDGLFRSRNVVAALLLKDYVGIDTGLDYLARVGLDRKEEQYLSIAMGGFNRGMTTLQMASAFTVFANKGVYTEPIFFTEVKDANGNVILSSMPKRQQVYSEQTVFIMNSMMQDVVTRGTAAPYGIVKYTETYTDANGKEKERTVTIPSAGKTGTSDETKDKWFVGFTPYYVGATWYGYDKAVTLTSAENTAALKIWNAVMTKIHKDMKLEPAEFFTETPPNIVTRTICMDSGKIATELCKADPRGSRARTEYFIQGTEPAYSDVCTTHVAARACKDAKDAQGRMLLATEYCPAGSVFDRVYIKRPVQYMPPFPNSPYPEDVVYELPEGEYCTIHGPHSVLVPPVTEVNPPAPPTPGNASGIQYPGNPDSLIPDHEIPGNAPDDEDWFLPENPGGRGKGGKRR